MAPSNTVIDLVSSEDEEVVEKVGDSKIPGRKRAALSNGIFVQNQHRRPTEEKRAAKKHKCTTENPYRRQVDGKSLVKTKKGAASFDAAANIVFDDASNDNAIITRGVLELLPENNILPGSKLCTGGRQSNRNSSTLCHIKQSDKWSCGFRNLQMMLTSMIPHMPANHSFFQTIPRRQPNPAIPSLRQLQTALEDSWKEGFDPAGARHFNYTIVGRASKIGAVEVSSGLTYSGVDSTVVQFIRCRESRGMLSNFIKAYFSKSVGIDGCPFCATKPSSSQQLRSDFCAKQLLQFANVGLQIEPACDCPLFPLYLQWEGHSVSIVGIAKDNSFLILDPLKDGRQMKTDLQRGKVPSCLRMQPKTLMKKDTQIVMCSLRCLSNREKQNRMANPSVVTAAQDAVMRVAGSRRF